MKQIIISILIFLASCKQENNTYTIGVTQYFKNNGRHAHYFHDAKMEENWKRYIVNDKEVEYQFYIVRYDSATAKNLNTDSVEIEVVKSP